VKKVRIWSIVLKEYKVLIVVQEQRIMAGPLGDS